MKVLDEKIMHVGFKILRVKMLKIHNCGCGTVSHWTPSEKINAAICYIFILIAAEYL